MSDDPLERLLGALGVAVLAAFASAVMAAIVIARINSMRQTCPRCASRMEEKTDWGEVAKGAFTLGLAYLTHGVVKDIGHGVGKVLGHTAGEISEHLAQDAAEHQFEHLAPHVGDLTYLLCPACNLPKRDDRLGCGAQLGLVFCIPATLGFMVLISQCSPSAPTAVTAATPSTPIMTAVKSPSPPTTEATAEPVPTNRKPVPKKGLAKLPKTKQLPASSATSAPSSQPPSTQSPGNTDVDTPPPASSSPWL